MPSHFLQTDNNLLNAALQDTKREMQEEAAQSQGKVYNLPYINLRHFPLDLQVLAEFSEEEARESQSIPFYREGKDIRIGTVDPTNKVLGLKLKELSEKYKTKLYIISKPSLDQFLGFYKKVLTPKSNYSEVIRISEAKDYSKELKNLQTLDVQKKLNATELIALVMGAAQYMSASDVHIEPEEGMLKVRYRLDGVLQDILHLEKSLQKTLIQRLKVVSKLKLNVENVPQDGRFTFYYLNKPIDVRVSSLPSAYGEGVVLRLLGTGATQLKLNDLGFRGVAYEVIEQELNKPNGMIVTTGPTGSGKTTTLYAFLNELNDPGVKIITLEDPVEYKLPGIQQTPIDHNVDFDFAKGLRAILRQDPDIVMVGEIRDPETAEVALQAALTGHIVLSTLHTNDAVGAVPRLYNMGIKPFVIAPALNAVIAQRLVRRLCTDCIETESLQPQTLERIHKVLGLIPRSAKVELPKELQFYHSKGCDACGGLGYKGRIGVYEVIQITDQIRDLILKQSSMQELKKLAVEQGMVSMLQDGLLKALDKITDVAEVYRVVGE